MDISISVLWRKQIITLYAVDKTARIHKYSQTGILQATTATSITTKTTTTATSITTKTTTTTTIITSLQR